MNRTLLFVCSIALALSATDCARDRSPDRHNPMDEPVGDAKLGKPWAEYEVAVRVANADGVKDSPDYATAATWCRRAAEHGRADAQAMLGVMHHRGQGVSQDDIEAYKWLTLAIRQQPADVDAFIMWRTEVGSQLTADQIASAERLAREWHPPRQDTVRPD